MPPFREKEALPVVLNEVVFCSLCFMCVYMLGKVGQSKPHIKNQDSLGSKPYKICEAYYIVLDAISWSK